MLFFDQDEISANESTGATDQRRALPHATNDLDFLNQRKAAFWNVITAFNYPSERHFVDKITLRTAHFA